MAKVLCVDDDESVARLVADIVTFAGHAPVVETDSMAAVVQHMNDASIRALLVDYMMPRLDGIEILTVWQERHPNVRRVLITAAPQESAVLEALRSGVAQMVIAKPPSINDIKLAVAWL